MDSYHHQLYDYVHKHLSDYGNSPHRLKSLIPLLQRIKFDSVLDVGCGPGQVLSWISEHYSEVLLKGIDISMVGCNKSPDLVSSGTIGYGCVQEIPYESDSFDLVICTDVLEHISRNEIDICFDEICRVSKRYVLIEVDDSPAGESKIARQRWKRIELHETRMPRKWWIQKIRDHDLKICKSPDIGRHKFIFLCKIV